MDSFITAATSYPTAIYTALLLVVLGYWLIALMGWVDFDSTDVDVELQSHGDADPAELSTLAGYLVALGLGGVPFSMVVSLLVLLSWVLSCLAGEWLLPLVPTAPLQWLAGTAVLLASLGAAIVATAQVVKPMRGLFVTHNAMGNASLVGQTCRILSQQVNARHGYAEVAQRGAGIQIRVWADEPNTLAKGSTAYLLAYDAAGQRYLVREVPEADL